MFWHYGCGVHPLDDTSSEYANTRDFCTTILLPESLHLSPKSVQTKISCNSEGGRVYIFPFTPSFGY
ncbi:unnamed protein product [Allacma fusca]|uniref:Uncharacterized protein n=1 Tax=Allacma fusca TaxID=39272 RepID=A0A8J2L1B4_9HEXA|nr:unnamed protein product [Allacma fusca]